MNENTASPYHTYDDLISTLEADPSWSEQRRHSKLFQSSFASQAAYRLECRKRKVAFGESGLQLVTVEELTLGREVLLFSLAALKRWSKCLGACGDIAMISDQAIKERTFPFALCPWNLETKFHESMCDWATKNGVELPMRDESGRPLHFIYGVEPLEEDSPSWIPFWAPDAANGLEPLPSSPFASRERA